MPYQELINIIAGLGTLIGASTAAFLVYWRSSHAERKAEKGDTELDKKISFLEGRLSEQRHIYEGQIKDLREEVHGLRTERSTWQTDRTKLIDLWKLERSRADKLQEQVNNQAGQINIQAGQIIQLKQDLDLIRGTRPLYETK